MGETGSIRFESPAQYKPQSTALASRGLNVVKSENYFLSSSPKPKTSGHPAIDHVAGLFQQGAPGALTENQNHCLARCLFARRIRYNLGD
jgi:hypothetical protein